MDEGEHVTSIEDPRRRWMEEEPSVRLAIDDASSRALTDRFYGIRLAWEHIHVEGQTSGGSCLKRLKFWKRAPRRVLLQDVSGIALNGQLTVLMGASGAGKTTLLNVLTQRNLRGLKIGGKVLANGMPVPKGAMKRLAAYVPQDDLMLGALTVREQLLFTAHMRLSKKWKRRERVEEVEQLITDMGLITCKDTLIGVPLRKGISLGEKKRLAFACELLTNPTILFCDEPTSGLDSVMALQVVTAMKRLAENGRTVVATIHQPSSQVFDLFDTMMLLANGRVAYHGPANQLQNYFSKRGIEFKQYCSPPQFVLRELSRKLDEEEAPFNKRIAKLCDDFEASSEGLSLAEDLEREGPSIRERITQSFNDHRYKASCIVQFWYLFLRSFRCLLRDPNVLVVRLVQVIVTAFIVGGMYFKIPLQKETVHSLNGAFFAAVRDMNVMFVFPCVHVFISEMEVVTREYESHLYRPLLYFLAKNLSDYVVYPICYGIIVYFMIDFEITALGAVYYCVTVIVLATLATSVGYMVSTIFGTISLATGITPVLILPLLAVGGFFIAPPSIPPFLQWLGYVSWHRYGFETLSAFMWNDVGPIPGCKKVNDTLPKGCLGDDGPAVLASNGFHYSHIPRNFGVLVGLVLLFRTISFTAFYIRLRRA